MQAKIADLDSRLSKVAEERSVTQEKISVLKENAEKLNPGKVDTMQENVRLVLGLTYILAHNV